MPLNENEEKICDDALTKKYSGIFRPFALRMCKEKKTDAKALKKILYGATTAYFGLNEYKKALKIFSGNSEINESALNAILSLHKSSKERLPFVYKFYNFIIENANVESVLDIGAGLNPLMIGLCPNYFNSVKTYTALDVDWRLARINELFFALSGINGKADCLDAISNTPEERATTAYLFKLAPLLERQKKGRAIELMENLRVSYIIITFPSKSLSGREKGMRRFYTENFKLPKNTEVIAKNEIGNEIIFILKKFF